VQVFDLLFLEDRFYEGHDIFGIEENYLYEHAIDKGIPNFLAGC
jgi:hypothetical protein